MMLRSLATALCLARALASAAFAAGGAPSAIDSYAYDCHRCHRRALAGASPELDALRAVIDRGDCVPDLGAKADSVCNAALESFSTAAPDAGADAEKEAVFDREVEDLERAVDVPLRLLYNRQLANLREKALRRYRDASVSAAGSEKAAEADYEAMVDADKVRRRARARACLSRVLRLLPRADYDDDSCSLARALSVTRTTVSTPRPVLRQGGGGEHAPGRRLGLWARARGAAGDDGRARDAHEAHDRRAAQGRAAAEQVHPAHPDVPAAAPAAPAAGVRPAEPAPARRRVPRARHVHQPLGPVPERCARARASESETRAPPAPPPPARPGALSGYISSRAPDSERRAPFPPPRPALSLSPPRGASPSLAGKTSLQLTCVPDDSAAMLGPNGFTRGVGPGNLGLSVTVNI